MDGNNTIWFGKHEGEKLSSIPNKYCEYLYKRFSKGPTLVDSNKDDLRKKKLFNYVADRLGLEPKHKVIQCIKIEFYPFNEDKEKQKEYRKVLDGIRDDSYKIFNETYKGVSFWDYAQYMPLYESDNMPKVGEKTNSLSKGIYAEIREKYPELNSGIACDIVNNAINDYENDKFDLNIGRQQYRNYKRNRSIPIRSQSIRKLHVEKKVFNGNDIEVFTGFFTGKVGVKFKLGSHHKARSVLKSIISGDYKLCDSWIKFSERNKLTGKPSKWVFGCIYEQPIDDVKLDYDKSATINLSFPEVVRLDFNDDKKKPHSVGFYSEYLKPLLNWKAQRRRISVECRFNKGGRGRNKKMRRLDKWGQRESNYIDSKMHMYSRYIIDYCIKHKIGKLIFNEIELKSHIEELPEEDRKLAVSNFGHFGLKSKIMYKARKAGINIETLEKKGK